MKKVALALLVVLTVASVSFAGWTPIGNLVPVDNGNALLDTYIVGLQVDDEGGISSISDISVTGDVCQVFFGGAAATPDMTFAAYLGANAAFDTHLLDLASYGDGITKVGGGWTETQDGSDPGQLGVAGAGIGDLVLLADATTIAINNAPSTLTSIEFLQVVVPAGGSAVVKGLYTNATAANAGTPMVPFEFSVPEPSTIVMLVLGALCLLIRRK